MAEPLVNTTGPPSFMFSPRPASMCRSREAQCDVLLVAATLSGLALLARAGRLEALGFTAEEVVDRLEARFTRES